MTNEQGALPVWFSPAKWEDVIDALHTKMMHQHDAERRKYWARLIRSLEKQRDDAATVLQ